MTRHQPFHRHDGAILRDFREFLAARKALHIAIRDHGPDSPEAAVLRGVFRRALDRAEGKPPRPDSPPPPPPPTEERTD